MERMIWDTDMERCDVVAHPALVDVDVRVPDQLVHNLMMQKVRLWRRRKRRGVMVDIRQGLWIPY